MNDGSRPAPPAIRVSVRTAYIPGRSDPDDERYFFAYTVTIHNEGDKPAQLLTRHWIITDSDGNREEVHGEGVVGKQPLLGPGESFEYTSPAWHSTRRYRNSCFHFPGLCTENAVKDP